MVTLYVDDKPVGTWAEAEKLFAETAKTRAVEFRDADGQVIAVTRPAEPLVPWDPSITRADLDRIAAEPGFTFDEVKKMLGWPS